jgi:hypothetical protein
MVQCDLPFAGGSSVPSAPIVTLPVVMPVITPAPPIITAPPDRLVFTPSSNTHASVIAAWGTLPHEKKYGKLRLIFDEPIEIRMHRRKVVTGKEVMVSLFIGNQSECLCYTFHKVTGYQLSSYELGHLTAIEPVNENELIEKCRKLTDRFHPNAWDDLKVQLLENPARYYHNHGYTVTNISSKFQDYVIESVRRAFEEKSNFTHDAGSFYSRRKSGRDLKVQCKLCDDGIFRAWFSSEFPGCANGDYWLLVNPTTAIFKERD